LGRLHNEIENLKEMIDMGLLCRAFVSLVAVGVDREQCRWSYGPNYSVPSCNNQEPTAPGAEEPGDHDVRFGSLADIKIGDQNVR
jgi:hypothetical protein